MKRIPVSCRWCGAKQSIFDHGGNYIYFNCFHCDGYNLYLKESNKTEKVDLSLETPVPGND